MINKNKKNKKNKMLLKSLRMFCKSTTVDVLAKLNESGMNSAQVHCMNKLCNLLGIAPHLNYDQFKLELNQHFQNDFMHDYLFPKWCACNRTEMIFRLNFLINFDGIPAEFFTVNNELNLVPVDQFKIRFVYYRTKKIYRVFK